MSGLVRLLGIAMELGELDAINSGQSRPAGCGREVALLTVSRQLSFAEQGRFMH